MAFVDDDDDEEDFVLQSASGYYFEDDDKTPVSFARLPIQWSDKEKADGNAAAFYLRGTAENGLLPLYRPVKAWRFDLNNFRPEISVLTKDNKWIKLEKPRKSFEDLITSVLITVHSLHFLRRNQEASEKSLWEHLSKSFKAYDVKPSQNDLVDHTDLIAEAVKRDVNLAQSKFILAFLAKKPAKKRLPDEENPKDDFIVGDYDTTVASDEAESDDEDDDFFESVCAICDNGGQLLCCEGSCLRSFHATKKDGEDSLCASLGFTKMRMEAIQKYYCPNCEHKIHQCYICRKLGSSDNTSGKAEVFQCVSATCGYFYHPRCVTKQLRLGSKAEDEALEKQIISGEFTCPLHKCSVCCNGEVKTDPNLQFAVCRRCPKSYHRKCLPRVISFEDDDDEDIVTRAWEGLLHNRVLIYCQEHEIDEELLTPVRDHVKFPFEEEQKVLVTHKRKILESHVGRDMARPKINEIASRETCRKAAVKPFRSSLPSSKDGVSAKKPGLVSSVPDHLRKRKEIHPSRAFNIGPNKSQKMMEYGESREAFRKKLEVNEPREAGKSKVGLNEVRKAPVKPGRMIPVDRKHNKSDSVASKEPESEVPILDIDSQRRLLAIMKKSTEEISMETVLKKYKNPYRYSNSTKNALDKTITMGKVAGSVQAIRTALKRLEEGGNIEDAKAVCEPEVLSQILKWKDKLQVYLAPFLHGARYTSFGRHFTKPDKLQQIVDKLHWYAEDGDMIVDFCCGANDFSPLMKVKLEETGKKCSYKNFDLFQAKNDFNFERRDWMTVGKDELEEGSRLIMGLNPPFGVNASRANDFVTKALQFRPKILILIVPPETERLDKKGDYVLIWEDEKCLSGQSFYLPGSVNNDDNKLDSWNKVSPPLSLWSRSDFAAEHRKIAEKHYHLSRDVGSSQLKDIEEEANASMHPPEASDGICHVNYVNSMPRESPFECGENTRLENEDVPIGIDELEVAECVNNILLSEKIEARETVAFVNHQSDDLPRRSQLEKEEKTKDYSGRMLRKSVDSNDVEEDQRELDRGLEGVEGRNPEMTSGWQSPVRSSDDIYAVCESLSNTTTPQRSQEFVEASLPEITRTKSNLGKAVREPNSKLQRVGKPEETRNRPGSSRDNTYTVRQSPANTVEPSFGECMSHFDDGLAARYGIGGGYRMPDPPYIPDQFPAAPATRNAPNEMFDYGGYPDLSRGMDTRGYLPRYSGQLDPMLAPPPPSLMDNTFPVLPRYAPHFDEMNYQRMNSFPPQPPIQPSGHSFYDPSGLPGDFRMNPMNFPPGPNHPYTGGPGGWIND